MANTINSPGSGSELERVKAELAELKQRFGLDKQEAFLEARADISCKEFAAMLHGRDCQPNLSSDELLLAQKRGFVVVYGDSDDRVEFEGAIQAEGHTNPFNKDIPVGVLALSEDGELFDENSELYAEYVKKNRNVIKVFYCNKDGLNWAFESDIPHETFLTYDGGYDEEYADLDDGFARCMVFELSALKRTSKKIVIAEQVINADVVRLDMNGKNIRDLSPLCELSCIEYLSLEENELKNLEHLSCLTNLKTLFLCHNKINDISPLRALTGLIMLSFWDNQITDVSPLRNMKNLIVLGLGSNSVADLSPLQPLTRLTEADLEHNNITDVAPLQTVSNLTKLYLSDNKITNIAPLQTLTNLIELGLYENQITDITPLFSLTNLTKLELQKNPLSESQIAELRSALPNCEIFF